MRTKSKKPSKQRKYENNVPYHEKHKLVSAHMSPELREKHGFRSLPVRIRDEVIIMKGKFKGHKGSVTKVNPQKRWVHVHQAMQKKSDSDIPVKIHPSNLMIVKIHKQKDRKRIALINRRTKNLDEFLDIDKIEEETSTDELDTNELTDTSEDFELQAEELELSDDDFKDDEELDLSDEKFDGEEEMNSSVEEPGAEPESTELKTNDVQEEESS